ncbi:hypothetical protein [Fibrella aquatilis]|uniref:Uncharacterized protein n=1 Tax=Fibrella aquatilis TaxID=2817059 RepID=A0A939JZX2_9BACT|nr:hypothetical protein [Fibrella aquatilis]MBO0931868.1 hypothetical protein [Fibrella aquatilis]
MAESLKERQARLAEKLKTEPHKAPIQEVNPVAEPDKTPQRESTNNSVIDDLVQFNVKVPKAMAKAVRQVSLDEDKDIRDIVQEAIKAYLDARKG